MIRQLFDFAYIEARKVWYFRWLALAVASAIFVAMSIMTFGIPNSYPSWGQVYVSRVSPLSVITEDVSLSEDKYGNPMLIEKTVLNDQNLLRVLKSLNRNFNTDDPRKVEGAIGALRGRISIKARDEDGFIEFHVKDGDPVRAQRTAKILIDQYISDNLKLSRSDLVQAGAFLDKQIVVYRQLMLDSQSKVATFRRQYPRVVAIATQSVGAGGGGSVSTVAVRSDTVAAPVPVDTSAIDGAIADEERRVASLLTQYTEKYPDVVAARSQIAALKAQRAALRSAAPVVAASTGAATGPQIVRRQVARPTVRARSVYAAAPAEVAAPDLTSQWAGLRRESDLIADNYQKLIQRREATKMSLAVYGSDAPGKFQITRAPTVPLVPTGPNRGLFLAASMVAAIGGGLAAAYLRAAISGIFVAPRELEVAFHLPVVGTVSWEPAWHTGGASKQQPALPFFGKDVTRLAGPNR